MEGILEPVVLPEADVKIFLTASVRRERSVDIKNWKKKVFHVIWKKLRKISKNAMNAIVQEKLHLSDRRKMQC